MNNMKSNIRTINSFLADPRSEVRKEQLLKLDRYALEMKSNGKELSFLKYWGASNKNELDKYDFDSLLMLFGLLKIIERHYNVPSNLTVIFTDTHAYLNGYNENSYIAYFKQVRHALNSFNFQHALMSEVINPHIIKYNNVECESFINHLIIDRSTIDKYQYSQNGIFKKFEESAKKYSKRLLLNKSDDLYISSKTEAATLYLYLNDLERKQVSDAFKNHCYITYVSEEEQKVTAPHMPIIQIYTSERGIRSRPWFKIKK